MKVHQLIALLAGEDQDAEVFTITGQGCPMQYEVQAVVAKEQFAGGHKTAEYDIVPGRTREISASEVFLIEGPVLRIWRPLRP